MDYENLGIRLSESFERISQMYLDLYNINYINDGLRASIDRLNDLQDTFKKSYLDIFNTQDIITISIENLKRSAQFTAENISKAINASFEGFKLNIDKTAYIFDDSDDLITFDEVDEVKDDILELVNDNFNEDKLEMCKQKWHEKHPVLYDMIVGILIALIGCLLESVVSNVFTKKDSNVYAEPDSKSSIVISVPKNTSITIIDKSINYYYKMIYTDTENNVDIEGYIFKGNTVSE